MYVAYVFSERWVTEQSTVFACKATPSRSVVSEKVCAVLLHRLLCMLHHAPPKLSHISMNKEVQTILVKPLTTQKVWIVHGAPPERWSSAINYWLLQDIGPRESRGLFSAHVDRYMRWHSVVWSSFSFLFMVYYATLPVTQTIYRIEM
jgi:hypothetical protein